MVLADGRAVGCRQCTVHSRAGKGIKLYWLMDGQCAVGNVQYIAELVRESNGTG
jgi:hypothetical protein